MNTCFAPFTNFKCYATALHVLAQRIFETCFNCNLTNPLAFFQDPDNLILLGSRAKQVPIILRFSTKRAGEDGRRLYTDAEADSRPQGHG